MEGIFGTEGIPGTEGIFGMVTRALFLAIIYSSYS
jgi:hypothetical protein